MVPPDKFIPIAEETGLIHEIGDLVFYKAAEVMSRWLEIDPHGYCQISVNMSARQFLPSDIGNAWISHLSIINLPANRLVIEITESLLLGEEINIMEKLNRFREAGIEVALDDFGTGYSAMSYLKKFNIDYLKIDRSFVRDLETDQNDRAIAEAIVVMAHKLGLKTIAEGVETEQQKNILAEVGCDYVQGYYFAKPLPVENFLSLVKIKLQ
jgi:EAL domain-containing protein (putative c-di-GMP-specific phosphodiesterase class I)